MPTHLTRFSSDRGPLLEVEVDLPIIFKALLRRLGHPVPLPHRCQALLDTGATATGVHESILIGLNLQGSDPIPISTPQGTSERRIYACSLSFPGTQLSPIPIVRAFGVDLTGFQPSVLIGWDILKNWSISCNGPAGLCYIDQR